MHRALVATLFACAACGGKNTIPATAEIKAAATSAQQSLDDTSTSTHATIGLQALTQGIGDAALSGSVAGVDLSGLPDPSGLASAAMAPPSNTIAQGLRAGSSGRAVSGTPTGCLVSDGTGTPALIEDGTLGCNAVDHLEVSYDDGDQVNITYAGTATTFDLRVDVVAGRWQGTSLHYSGTYDAATGSSARVAVSGALEYSSASIPAVIDADFQVSYHLSVFDSATGQGVSVAVNGTAADHVALVRATQDWTFTAQTNTSGQTTQSTADWTGNAELDLLKTDDVTTDHAVRFDGLNLHVSAVSSSNSGSVTFTAGGDLEWDGAIVGQVVVKNGEVVVDWTDGTDSSFDPSTLVGSAAI
jgi:hypothetical protein